MDGDVVRGIVSSDAICRLDTLRRRPSRNSSKPTSLSCRNSSVFAGADDYGAHRSNGQLSPVLLDQFGAHYDGPPAAATRPVSDPEPDGDADSGRASAVLPYRPFLHEGDRSEYGVCYLPALKQKLYLIHDGRSSIVDPRDHQLLEQLEVALLQRIRRQIEGIQQGDEVSFLVFVKNVVDNDGPHRYAEDLEPLLLELLWLVVHTSLGNGGG